MYAQVEAHRTEIEELCRRLGVSRLFLFGSAVSGGFDPDSSDLDFLVEFESQDAGYSDRYFTLSESLSEIFGMSVDLVTADSIKNPFFRSSVEAFRTLVFAA